MSSAPTINSFRVLLSSLLAGKVTTDEEELDEMIHYVLSRDFDNIQLLGEEISEELLFLIATMKEENLLTMEDLFKFFDVKHQEIMNELRQPENKKKTLKKVVVRFHGIPMLLDFTSLVEAITRTPFMCAEHQKSLRYHVANGEMDAYKTELVRSQSSESTISADGALVLAIKE